MQNMWAPWRMQYILGPKADSCIFCLPEDNTEDHERMILHRGKHCFVIMNRFPYSGGHLMVVPYAHLSCITDFTSETASEYMQLISESARILRQCFQPQGLNIGMNIGAAAGAGVKEHVHCHLVPRWSGDANFMTILAEVRVIPEHIEATYKTLLPLFSNLDD